jgi:hypothetical protein
MLDSPHTSVPMLMRGNTPPTTRSPPHRSRPAGYPPNRQPATVGEEERGGRGTISRRTSTRAAPEEQSFSARCTDSPLSQSEPLPASLPTECCDPLPLPHQLVHVCVCVQAAVAVHLPYAPFLLAPPCACCGSSRGGAVRRASLRRVTALR